MNEVLENIGLTRSESKVYLALLRTGGATISDIIRESDMHSSVAYNSLQKLQNKGFVSYNLQGKRKRFFATDPSTIKEILNERYKDFENSISMFSDISNSFGPAQKLRIFEGNNGIRMLFRDVLASLKKGDEHLVLGVSSTDSGLGDAIRDWDEKRIKSGINKRVLLSEKNKEWIDFYKKRPFTKIKILPTIYNSGMTINIYGEKSALVIWGRHPITIILDNKEINRNFKIYFELLWRVSKTL